MKNSDIHAPTVAVMIEPIKLLEDKLSKPNTSPPTTEPIMPTYISDNTKATAFHYVACDKASNSTDD